MCFYSFWSSFTFHCNSVRLTCCIKRLLDLTWLDLSRALHSYATLKHDKQVALLSQRGRAMLRVIDYFARSLKVIRNDTVEQSACKSLLVFQNPPIQTMTVSRTVSETFTVKQWRDLKIVGKGHSRSLKMAPFDRKYTTFYWSAIVNSL